MKLKTKVILILLCIGVALAFLVFRKVQTPAEEPASEEAVQPSQTPAGTQDKNSALAKEHVYSYENLALGEDLSGASVLAMAYQNGRLLVVVNQAQSSYNRTTREYLNENELTLFDCNPDGSDSRSVRLEDPESGMEGRILRVCISAGGDVYVLKEIYEPLEETAEGEEAQYVQDSCLVRYDSGGTLLWRKSMKEEPSGGEEGFYANNMGVDGEGNVTFYTNREEPLLITYDGEGSRLGEARLPETLQNLGRVMFRPQGDLLITTYNDDYSQMFVQSYDPKTGVLSEAARMPEWFSNYTYQLGTESDFILISDGGAFTYNIGDEEPVKFLDYVNSDLPASGIELLCHVDGKHFVAAYTSIVEEQTQLAYFTYLEPDQIEEKKTLVLGCYGLDAGLKKRVVEFNHNSASYRITVHDYAHYYGAYNYMEGYTRLNNDIIRGEMPDILLTDDNMPIESYIEKGLLADIDSLIREDPELAGMAYMENVLDAYRMDGRLYRVFPGFQIRTMLAKTSLVGEQRGWTMEELELFMEQMPRDCTPFGDVLRSTFMSMMMEYVGNEFVDWDSGRCDFRSQEFLSLLEYAKTLPDTYPQGYFDHYDYSEYENRFREDKAVLCEITVGDVWDLYYAVRGRFGEPVTYMGFPSQSGDGSVLFASGDVFVLSASSPYLEGAWEFARYYLTPEYQESGDFVGMPLSRSLLEKQLEDTTRQPWREDEEGNREYYDNPYYLNGEQITLEPFTQSEAQEVLRFIESVDRRAYYDQEVLQIVDEETGAFFSGQKSAQEVASVIENRVQLYLDENS